MMPDLNEYKEKRKNFFLANKILFLYPEIASVSSFSFSNKHLGASYIRAYLKENTIPASYFTAEGSLGLYEAIEGILGENPEFVCVSVYDCTYFTVKMIVKELKKQKPGLKVIVGGPTPTFSDTVIMEDFPEVDLCVRGEGEYTALEIFDSIYQGRGFSKIKGITYRRRKTGKIIRNPDRELIIGDDKDSEIDILPSPFQQDIISPQEGAQIGIVTSRGCVFKCVYCNFSAMSRWTVRFHSLKRVIDELAYIAQHKENGKKNSVTIQDDAFTLNKERAKQICREIIKRDLGLLIDCETRADTVDKELLELMRLAGFRYLHFGLESGSPKVLKEIKKARSAKEKDDGFAPEEKFLQNIKDAVHTSLQFSLKPTVSIILGLPAETHKEGLESINFVSSLDKCQYYHNYLEIFAGTELFKTHEAYGLGLKHVYKDAVNRLYKTIYPYDVSGIQEIEERSIFNSKDQAAEISALFCGDHYLFERKHDRNYPLLVIFTNAIFPDISSIEWFLKNAGSDTRLTILWQNKNKNGQIDSTQFYEMHMPLQMFYRLKEHSSAKDEAMLYEESFEKNSENFTDFHFCFLDINDHETQKTLAKSEPHDTQYIYLLQPKTYSKTYLREVEKLLCLKNLFYSSRILNSNVLDTCRWSKSKCPALSMERVIIDQNIHLYPCLSGRPVGRITEKIDTVKGRIAKLFAHIQQIRGCAHCPVEAQCSQCIFPYPMNPYEFCRIQLRTLL